MSNTDDELSIVNSFRELLNYIVGLAEQINQLDDRLEKIELETNKTKVDLEGSLKENKKELENIKNTIITKTEFNTLLQKLNQPFEKFSPPKTERTRKTRTPATT
jgi:hypothetical protein